jgi:hypothetical protein
MYVRNMAIEGSYTGKLALATLAADLGISAVALETVLEEAFEIMEDNVIGTPGLCLHIALPRLGHLIDGNVLYAKVSWFRSIFAERLSEAPGREKYGYNPCIVADFVARLSYSQVPIARMRPNSSQAMREVAARPAVPQPHHTPAAMTWRSEEHIPSLIKVPSMPSHHTPDGFVSQSTYSRQPPMYTQDQPTYLQDKPTYTQDQPTYIQGQPVYNQHPPSYTRCSGIRQEQKLVWDEQLMWDPLQKNSQRH